MPNAKVLLISTLALLALHREAALAATPVTGCGETVTDGVLAADLDCSSAPDFALTVADGGTLDLAGYTLTGTADYGINYTVEHLSGGVLCLGSCTIVGGGGAIIAPTGLPAQTWSSFGVFSDPNARRGVVSVSDTTFTGWPSAGVQGVELRITGSTFTGNRFGVLGRKRTVVDDSTFSGNTEDALHPVNLKITNSTITGNVGGIYCLRKCRVTQTTVDGNDYYGFYGLKLLADGSSLVNNCLSVPFVDAPCADITAFFQRRPRLIGSSSCGTSLRDQEGATWNVCSLD